MGRGASWAGNPPHDDEEARRRILTAAAEVLLRLGVAKFSAAEVAASVGISRTTLYAHFPTRDRLVAAALQYAARDAVERTVADLRGMDDPAEQMIEIVLRAVGKLRADPLLAMTIAPGGPMGFGRSVRDVIPIFRRILAPVVERCPELSDDLDEVAEVTIRFLVSLLEHPREGGDRALANFLRRRFLPALGLAPAADLRSGP